MTYNSTVNTFNYPHPHPVDKVHAPVRLNPGSANVVKGSTTYEYSFYRFLIIKYNLNTCNSLLQ